VTGGLVDVTPNARGEHYVVFASDHEVPADFDYLDRPVPRRFSTYVPPTRQDRVAAAGRLVARHHSRMLPTRWTQGRIGSEDGA
jgi:hypothetical protein